jgi:hypothetical protein
MITIKQLFIFFTLIIITAAGHAQPNVIVDTDIGSDCDDAGALAVLHKLADKGEVNILGVIFSSGKNKYGIGVCDAINTYYSRAGLTLGQYKGDDVGDATNTYSMAIATDRKRFPHHVVDSAMELVSAYKTILAKQQNSSVTIVTLGHPNGLAALMRDKKGRDLIKQKVKNWVAMAYADTIPVRDWNFGKNGAETCIAELLKQWPTPVYLSWYGKDIITGNKKLPMTANNNPVKQAYHLWNNALVSGRSSWDQLAILFTVRPQYFAVEAGALQQNDHYETYWKTDPKNIKQHRVKPVLSNLELETIIEDLMAAPPLHSVN